MTNCGDTRQSGRPGLPGKDRQELTTGIIRRFAQVMFVLLFQAAVLFLSAGRLKWTWAWVYLGLCVASLVINATVMLRTSPETIAERGRPRETKDWDKLVGGLWALALFVLVPLLAGLDVRFGWTEELDPRWNVVGAVLLASGFGLAGWAMMVNAYFSTAVRIQSDRGQTVCRTGPYRLIRHPGYLGFILQSVGTPLTLGGLWSLLPGIIAVILMILRTSLEDRMLQAELPGYRDFVREVRYRLWPGVW